MNTQKKKKGKLLKRIIGLVLVLAIAGAGVWYFTKGTPVAEADDYTAYTASIGSISNALSFSGTFSAVDSKTYTSAAATTVREVYVAAGQDVLQGDKLVRLANGETIKADFDGRVNSLAVSAEDSVASGDTLLQIADFEHLQISVQVDEYDISSVAVGQQCLVTATASSQMMVAQINSISYISSTSTGSVAYYTAIVKVDAPTGVYPGMQASVVITQEEATDVVLVKQSALNFDEYNQAYVYMKNDAGENEKVTVEVGVTNGYYVEIKSGLSDGDVVYAKDDGTTTTNSTGLNMMMFGMGGGGDMGGGQRMEFNSSERPSMPSGSGNGGSSGMPSGGGN